MIRFISIEKDDILNSPEDAADLLSHASRRKIPMRYMGIHAAPEAPAFTVFMEETEEAEPYSFVFSPMDSAADDDVAATVKHRYEAGYSTLAIFRIEDTVWGLFARKKR